MKKYEVIVIGAGHNGLVCAAYLAKAGRRVLVLEADEKPGGAARTREFYDGYRVSAGAHLLNQLSPKVSADLKLDEKRLKFAARDLDQRSTLTSSVRAMSLSFLYCSMRAGRYPNSGTYHVAR